MKKLLLVLILSYVAFPQAGKSVLTEKQKSIFGIEYLSRFADLSTAVSSIGSEKTLMIDESETISSELIIPSNITLEFVNGAILTVSDTLIINGSINKTMNQIFTGAGYVNFSGMKDKKVYPEWWGVKTNGVDYSTQITKCVQDSVTLVFSAGVYTMYNVASGDVYDILPNDGVSYFTIEGNNTIIKAPNGIGSYSSFLFSTASHVTIRGIEFNGNRDNLTEIGHNCLYFANSEYITVENNYIHNYKDLADDPAAGGSGILLIESSQAIIRGNIIRGTDVAVYPIGLHDFTISNNKIYEGVSEAIALDVGFWTGKRNRRGIISDNLSTRAFTLNCASDVIVTGNTILEENIAGLLIGLQAVGDSSFYADSCYAENIVASNNLIKHTVNIGYSLVPTVAPTKFYAKNVILSNNTIYPSVAGGIYIFTGENIDIKNNLITVDIDSVNSLIQSYPDSTYLKNISIENNTLRTNQDTVVYGIITSGYPLYIKNNIVTGNFTTGILVLTQSDKLDSVYVSNNITSATLYSAYGTPNNMWDNIASNINPGAQIFQDSYIFSNTLNVDTTTFSYGYAIVQVFGDTEIDSITNQPSGTILHLKFQDTLTVHSYDGDGNIRLRTTTPADYRSTLLSTLTLISSGSYWWEFARSNDGSTIGVPDTTGVTDGYVQKYVGGDIVWSPDVSTSGAGLFNPDGVTIDTTAGGLARVLPAKVTKWDSVTVLTSALTTKFNTSDTTAFNSKALTTAQLAYKLDKSDTSAFVSDALLSASLAYYSLAAHSHTDFYDTLSISWGVLDTTYTGSLSGWKVPNDITITEISAYTDANTVTFNLEERAETTPNTAGTDVIGSDLVADTNQEETSTFTNATIAKNTWLVPTISATGDVSIFTISVRYIKTD